MRLLTSAGVTVYRRCARAVYAHLTRTYWLYSVLIKMV